MRDDLQVDAVRTDAGVELLPASDHASTDRAPRRGERFCPRSRPPLPTISVSAAASRAAAAAVDAVDDSTASQARTASPALAF